MQDPQHRGREEAEELKKEGDRRLDKLKKIKIKSNNRPGENSQRCEEKAKKIVAALQEFNEYE